MAPEVKLVKVALQQEGRLRNGLRIIITLARFIFVTRSWSFISDGDGDGEGERVSKKKGREEETGGDEAACRCCKSDLFCLISGAPASPEAPFNRMLQLSVCKSERENSKRKRKSKSKSKIVYDLKLWMFLLVSLFDSV
ncbi:hypothetical protein O6H91_07G037400 [Diphasiastrum complanatum]|uniref:Uncharacterized protein n=1 Tax=Diphasiastrum complanatum TaxID=34168 RepID=A0ACC2D493_DIPCM|nr:hypothetical protein O6H91_07G037400 [Diphasiastrum complanatum]